MRAIPHVIQYTRHIKLNPDLLGDLSYPAVLYDGSFNNFLNMKTIIPIVMANNTNNHPEKNCATVPIFVFLCVCFIIWRIQL